MPTQNQVEVDIKVNVDDKELPGLKKKIKDIGDEGKKSFKEVEQTSGACLTNFMGSMNLTKSQMQTLEELTSNWSKTLDFTRSKLQRMGVDTQSLTGKLRVVGTAIQIQLGNKWNAVKTKVNEVATAIKTKIGGAITSVKSRFSGLNSAFSKLQGAAKKTSGGMNMLSTTASMTVGMLGYDLVMSMTNSARESINAAGKMQAFGKRLGMSAQEIQAFSKETDNLQKDFRKVDMRAVGASAEELGVKLKLPKEQMGDLTRMTAVMSSAFVNEGRTQEDAIMAVSDAMDGQFKRLQELGITEDKLVKNGWNGNIEDTNSLMQAMNKTMDEMGFTETAQGIYSLDDAYKALEVAGGRLLADVLIPLTPVITGVVDAVISGIDKIKGVAATIQSIWEGLPDWAQYAIGIAGFALAIGVVVSALGGFTGIIMSIVSTIGGVIGVIAGISWPLVAIVAAIAAVGVAIYEFGKYMGWWKDFGSMIDAVWAGIQRIWSAFINHPDVQAVLSAIGAAWNWLVEVTKPVIDWLGDLWNWIFPPDAQGKVDAVGNLINALGFIWEIASAPIKAYIDMLQNLWNAMSTLYSTVLVPVYNFLMSIFIPVWNLITVVMNLVYVHVLQLINIFQMFLDGQISLGEAISMIWNTLKSLFSSVMNAIIGKVREWAGQLVAKVKEAASQFITGFINGLAGLPGAFAGKLGEVFNKLVQWGSDMVNKATEIAGQVKDKIVNGVKNTLNLGFNYGFDGSTGTTTNAGLNYGFDGGTGSTGNIKNITNNKVLNSKATNNNKVLNYDFDTNNTMNKTISHTVATTSNTQTVNNNFNIHGLIEKSAQEYIVKAVNDNIRKQNLIRGV